jgi:hypothetical protein
MYNKVFFKKHNVCIFCESTNRKKISVYFHQTVNKKITVLYLQKKLQFIKKSLNNFIASDIFLSVEELHRLKLNFRKKVLFYSSFLSSTTPKRELMESGPSKKLGASSQGRASRGNEQTRVL